MKFCRNEGVVLIEEQKVFTLTHDGFIGKLYQPIVSAFPGKALVLFSGSDGSFKLACLGAQTLAAKGIAVLAIAYFKLPGLPESLARVPVEPVEKAAKWLKASGYEKVGVWGISMGAELAFLAGICMPDLISCVIAASPICVVTQGMTEKNEFLPCSCLTWRGKDFPYAPYPFRKATLSKVLASWRKYGDFGYRICYEGLIEAPDERYVIPVEKINGPILMFSGKLDSMWPAYESGEYLMRRLDAKHFAFAHEHYSYEYGSHFMVPIHLKAERFFKSERKHKSESDLYKKDQMEKTLAFLERWGTT